MYQKWSILFILMLTIVLIGCQPQVEADVLFRAELVESNNSEVLSSYANLRFHKNYPAAFQTVRNDEEPLNNITSLYIWDETLRQTLATKLHAMVQELKELHDQLYTFHVERSEEVVITAGKRTVGHFDVDQASLLLVLWLPPQFRANPKEIMLTFQQAANYLEVASDGQLIQLSSTTKTERWGQLELSTFYGLGDKHEVNQLMLGRYEERDVQALDEQLEILVDQPKVRFLSQGQFYWFKYTPSLTNQYQIYLTGNAKLKMEVYEQLNKKLIEQGDSGTIELSLIKDQPIYIKVSGTTVIEQGSFMIEVREK